MADFGEIIYSYTLDQAIEDGLHADFGRVHNVRVVATTGFMQTVNTYQLMHIVSRTLDKIRPDKPNWVVFKTEKTEDHVEDEGRTFVTSIDGLEKKVYAILENHGDHYVLTFLLAEEY